jgi:hypothetical protein
MKASKAAKATFREAGNRLRKVAIKNTIKAKKIRDERRRSYTLPKKKELENDLLTNPKEKIAPLFLIYFLHFFRF